MYKVIQYQRQYYSSAVSKTSNITVMIRGKRQLVTVNPLMDKAGKHGSEVGSTRDTFAGSEK